jgi:1,4-dihydroxy-2-naphthoate octaprenyltransferase
MVQAGTISWIPAIWAVPMFLLVVGILHANNWRDIQNDTGAGIRTMASLLGDRKSEGYDVFLLFAPFSLLFLFILVSRSARERSENACNVSGHASGTVIGTKADEKP